MYILAPNQIVEKYPYSIGELRKDNPNTSFPKNPDAETLAEWYVYSVQETPQPEYNRITQNCTEINPVYKSNQWMQQWEVVDLDPEQIAYNEQQARLGNKQTAESFLQETDWTATVDISNPEYSNPYLGNQAEFLAYRSAVRKIAVNPPVTVTEWPVKPDEAWAYTNA